MSSKFKSILVSTLISGILSGSIAGYTEYQFGYKDGYDTGYKNRNLLTEQRLAAAVRFATLDGKIKCEDVINDKSKPYFDHVYLCGMALLAIPKV